MSDLPPPAPAVPAPPPQMMARLDPPPDVQAAVAAALHACHAWQPTPVPPPVPGGTLPAFPLVAGTTEAGVCDVIDDWPHAAEGTAMFVLSAGVALGLAAAVLLLALRRGLRAFWRTQLGGRLRDTLGEPWRDVQAAALGALGGVVAVLMLADVLRQLGVGVPSIPGRPLLSAGGAAGAAGGIWLRRHLLRRDVHGVPR